MIVKPPELYIDVDIFVQTPVWKAMYEEMFVAAAQVIIPRSNPDALYSNSYPWIDVNLIYDAVRVVPEEQFPNRPPPNQIALPRSWRLDDLIASSNGAKDISNIFRARLNIVRIWF